MASSKKKASKSKGKPNPNQKAAAKKTTDAKKKIWKEAFLESFDRTRSIRASAKEIGIHFSTVYREKKEDPIFGKAVTINRAVHVDDLEASAFNKAIDGWDEPVFYQGIESGVKRVFSVTLMIFMLKCWKPERYNIENRATEEDAKEIAAKIRAELKEMRNTVPSKKGK
jgi:hypothetical protein